MVARSQRPPAIPPQIGPFRIEGVIAKGGMGVVYRARHEGTQLPAAVKTVRLRHESHLTSIRRELHALGELHHPGVVRILAQGIERDLPWYAMELLEGETLATYKRRVWRSAPERVAAAGRLPEALTIIHRVCAPLGFLHGEGIVHADLKPENIFLRSDGQPILVDFGISRRVGSRGREIPELPALGGTPAYMAPHQIRGDLLEARDDLYSLGCILYELIAERPPFVGDSAADVAWRHMRETPAPPSQLVEGVPPALDRLVLSLLEKDPRERAGDADDVADALEEIGAAPDPARHARRRANLYRPRLIGRDVPLSKLMDLVHGLRSGHGALALIAGESGIGKTYLALDVARRAALANALVLNGSCVPGGGTTPGAGDAPLHPFRELLLAVADRCTSGGRAVTEQLLGSRAKVLASIEPRLAHLSGATALPDPPALAGTAARDRLLDALVETICALARDRSLVLVLDDLQWADELTFRVLDLLATRITDRAPILLLGTVRTDEAASRPEFLDRLNSHVIRIGGLDRDSVRSLVADMLAIENPPDPFVQFLARQSEGNPFFVAEYLRTSIAEGMIRRLGQRSLAMTKSAERSIEALEALPFPATLRDVVSRRFSGLSANAQARVEVAAVMGRELDVEILDSAGGVDDSATTELLSRQVLEQLRPGILRFTHDKLREIAYERIVPDRRGTLHLGVAEAIERVRGGLPDFAATSAVLSHHYLAAGKTAKALDYLEKAGAHALSVGAYREAIGFFEQCIERAGSAEARSDPVRIVRWRRQLSDAYTGTGNLAARSREATGAIAAAGGTAAAPLAVAVPRALFQLALQALRARLPPRRDASRSEPLHLELARAHRHMAVVHYFRNDPVPMIVRLIDAIEHAERAGPSVELAGAYAETGAVFGIAGFDGAGKRYLRQAIEIAQRIGHPPTLAYVHMVNCLYSVGVGRWQAVRSSAAECQSICDRLGDHVNWGNAQIVRFWLHHYLGEPRESAEAAQNLLARARKIGNQQQEVWALCGAGLAGLRLDRSAEALRYLEDAARLHEHSDQNNLILTLGCEALARMRLGDVERAQEVAKAALEMLMRVRRPTGHATLEGCSAIAEVVLSAPRVRFDLAKLAVEGLRRYRKAFPIGEPRYRYWRGVLRSRANRQRGAMRSWMLGIRAARDLSMTYDVALIEERIGAWH